MRAVYNIHCIHIIPNKNYTNPGQYIMYCLLSVILLDKQHATYKRMIHFNLYLLLIGVGIDAI